ncbi:MAG: cystathionine beta-lyase [Neomegalonema sp.]|nr:cystathionine beta-lyase [Neomegalonema sp.]
MAGSEFETGSRSVSQQALTDESVAVTAGRSPSAHHGTVNPPVYHASTILMDSYAALRDAHKIRPGDGITYGVHGTPGTYAFEEAVAALEGGYRTRLCSSGLTAVTGPLLSYLSAGDHLLMVDSVYGPTRRFCEGTLRRMGIETTYYDPLIGEGIAALIRPNTRVIFLESPGSWTFEVQDIPAIVAVAQEAGIWTMIDNTWASPLYFKPFAHGVDVSIQAATKYIAGHSDLVMGAVTTSERAYPLLQKGWMELGLCASPDDVYLAMRGLRTIAPRLRQHWANGLAVADWLTRQPEVVDLLHPAHPDDPGHALWSRDFLGACGLFAFTLHPSVSSDAHLSAFLDQMALFGMGYSWGGFESLLLPTDPASIRSAVRWPRAGRAEGKVMRIHIGLEGLDDLLLDLDRGFARLRAV